MPLLPSVCDLSWGEVLPQSPRWSPGKFELAFATHLPQNRTSLSEEQLREAMTAGRNSGPPEGRGQTQRLSQVTG